MIKIAICDDEKYFVDTVEKMLKIYAEKNGKDFCIKKYTKPLQLMESLKEEFQIFFLDIEMPAMDGMELVDIIRRHDEKSIILYGLLLLKKNLTVNSLSQLQLHHRHHYK